MALRGYNAGLRKICFRRSLGATVSPLTEAGFRLEKILEPKPTDEFKKADPKHYEELSRQPCFLCIRAGK
jgi:hypothetical protein